MSPSASGAVRRDPVHHLLVDRRAQRRRIAAVALERRLGAARRAPAARPPRRAPPSSRPAPPSPRAPPARRPRARSPRASSRSRAATCRRSQPHAPGRRRLGNRRVDRRRSPRRRLVAVDRPERRPRRVVTRRAACVCRWYTFSRSRTISSPSSTRVTSAPPHFSHAVVQSHRRVRAAAAADPPRRQPPHQHVLRHDDVEHDQRAAAVHHPVERRRPGRPCAETRRARTRGARPAASSRSRDDPDHHVVADQAGRRPSSLLRDAAERRARLHRLAQDVAGRDLRQAAALARAARPACPCPLPAGRASRR